MARKRKQNKVIPGAVSAKIYAGSTSLKYAIKLEERSVYEMRVDPNILAAVHDYYEADGDDAPRVDAFDRTALEAHVIGACTMSEVDFDEYAGFEGGTDVANEQIFAIHQRSPDQGTTRALSLVAWLAVRKGNDQTLQGLARGRKGLKVFDARGLKSQQRAKGLGPMSHEEIEENLEIFVGQDDDSAVNLSYYELITAAERDSQARTLTELLDARGRMNRQQSFLSSSASDITTMPARRGFLRRAPIRVK